MTQHRDREEELREFFVTNSGRVQRAIGRRIYAPPELIADACANAWLILLRRPDISLDSAGLGWLITVALNEARRLLGRAQRETPVGVFRSGLGCADGADREPVDVDACPVEERVLDRVEHHERLRIVQQLKPREREALYLKALGYSYREIGRLTDASYTAVDRRLKEGRARLRRLQASDATR